MEPHAPLSGDHVGVSSNIRPKDPEGDLEGASTAPPGPVPVVRGSLPEARVVQSSGPAGETPVLRPAGLPGAAPSHGGRESPDPTECSPTPGKAGRVSRGATLYSAGGGARRGEAWSSPVVAGAAGLQHYTVSTLPTCVDGELRATGKTDPGQVSQVMARPSRSSSSVSGMLSPMSFSSIASPRQAAVAAATCCGSRRTVDTAERLMLPPRRAHCIGSTGRLGYARRQETLATWAVAVAAALGLPLIVSCAYALLLSLEADGMVAAVRVQLPWIQLSAVAAIGVTFVVVVARAWLRWPARSSSAFCMQLVATVLFVALTAGYLYGIHNAALVVNGESGQQISVGAAGSIQCVAPDLDSPVGGFCDVSTRIVAVPVDGNGTMLAGIEDHLWGIVQASHAAVSASLLLVGAHASRDVVDRCVNDALLPWLCESALPTCTGSCSPMKPCRSWCFDVRDKCPFLVDDLRQFVRPDGDLDTIVDPLVRQQLSFGSYFEELLACDDGEHWSDGDVCSIRETSGTAAVTPQGPCGALLRAAAATTVSRATTADSVRWRWTGILAIAAAVVSAFVVVVAQFCGVFVPVPCLLSPHRRQASSFRGTATGDCDSDDVIMHTEESPTNVVSSPTESASLDSRGTTSDTTSPNSRYHDDGKILSGGGAEVQGHRASKDHAFGTQPKLSPASDLRAGMIRRGVLAPVNETQPQSPKSLGHIVWDIPTPLSGRSPHGLAMKSPAVLMRRDGGFKGGERGIVRSASIGRKKLAGFDAANRTESEPDAIATRLLNPSVGHVLDYRNFVAGAVLGCSGVCLLRLGLVAEYAGEAGSAAAFDAVAVVSIAVAITSLIDWRFIYAEGVSVYRHGERRYLRMRAADTASFAARARFRLRWFRARWRELFGLRGLYFKQRLFLMEAVEVTVQIVGLLDRLDAAANSEIVFVVSLLVVNVAGAAVLHYRDSTTGSAAASLLFELVCDVVVLVHLVVVVSSDTVAITPTQVIGLLVPSLATLFTIRTLNRVVIMQLAASDAADAGVVKHLGATTTKSLRQFRVHVDSSTSGSEQQGQWDDWERQMSAVVDVSDGDAPSSRQVFIRFIRTIHLWVLFFVVVPAAFATVVRLVVADVTCAARVGPLWSGVTASSKTLLAGGFFSEPACPVNQVLHLDLRDADVQTIGEDVLQFTSLREIDARGNQKLLHVSAAVAKLPALKRLRLDGTAAARHILWGSAHLDEFPDILRSISEVEILDLSGNNISVIDDADVAALESLHTLILSNNALTTLPGRLGTHSRLRVLLASGNELSGVSQGLVPLIRRLDSLDLSDNQLTELPTALGSHVFDYLNVTGNSVAELNWGASGINNVPNAILDLPLRVLILSENGLRDIPTEISRLSKLEFLDVSRNALTALPEGMGQLQNLRTLIAHTNYFNDAAVTAAWNLPKLESVDFACCALCTVPDSVWLSSTLQHLDLSFNPLGSSSISRVDAGLVTAPLRALNLQSTRVQVVPTMLIDSGLHDTVQGVVLPSSVARVDPDGVEALGLACSLENDGTEDSLCCGSVPESWPRTNVRSSCAFGHAPQATQCPVVSVL